MTNSSHIYDVVVVGGAAAGLAATIALSRARRSVVVIDAGDPRNSPAAGIHNFLGHDGVSPAELARIGRAEAERYGATFVAGNAISTTGALGRFDVTTDDRETVSGRRLVIATGVTDTLPDVPGLREHWGTDVVHCPYCHGWEIQDRHIGVIAHPAMPSHQALMFRQWSDSITVFTDARATLSDDEREQFAARGIAVVETALEAVESNGTSLSGIRTVDGEVHSLDAIAVASTVHPRIDVFSGLGLAVAENPLGFGSSIEVDAMGATNVAGVWAAGNATDLRAQVMTSAAMGLNTGAAVNGDLILEDTRLAVERYREMEA